MDRGYLYSIEGGELKPSIIWPKASPVKTFTALKPLTDMPQFESRKQRQLSGLDDGMIDPPLVDLIHAFNGLPQCFTLQTCYGHFLYSGQADSHCLAAVPKTKPDGAIEYRIAYIALCLEGNAAGRELLEVLSDIQTLAPGDIQFGCAEWFWQRQPNSYVLQVEPERFKEQDRAELTWEEAVWVEKVRNAFFKRLVTEIRVF